MRILIVADGRSPISLQWLTVLRNPNDEVHLVSTFACPPPEELASFSIVNVAFSGAKTGKNGPQGKSLLAGARLLALRTALRQWLGPLTLQSAARRLRGIIEQIQPDLIHALRIPYEGMLAAETLHNRPLLISVWGNDFTLHAPSTPLMRHYTQWAMHRANGLHADCERDVQLAKKWGLNPAAPTLVTPGNGGIRREIFFPAEPAALAPLVVNPRGFRAYVRNDAFFESIALVLRERPDARFACASMAAEPQAITALERLGITHAVDLLPARPHAAMADLFRAAQVVVSPASHDGTPNSLLEGMACGCLPVAGDLESIREWIVDGENGLLVDPADPRALAQAILRGLNDASLRARAARRNAEIIAARADYAANIERIRSFYARVAAI